MPSIFDPLFLEHVTAPSLQDALDEALAANPLYLDEPVRTSEICRMLGCSQNALTAMHKRGLGPDFTTLPGGSRLRLYTRRTVLRWMHSEHPPAKRALNRILARYPEQEVAA